MITYEILPPPPAPEPVLLDAETMDLLRAVQHAWVIPMRDGTGMRMSLNGVILNLVHYYNDHS